jgi:hypothetical protein
MPSPITHHPKMTKAQLRRAHAEAKQKLSKMRPKPKLPRLENTDGSFTIAGLSFVFFYTNLRRIVTKSDLLSFLRVHSLCKDTMPQVCMYESCKINECYLHFDVV